MSTTGSSSNIVISSNRLEKIMKVVRVGDLLPVFIIGLIDDNRYKIKLQGIELVALFNGAFDSGDIVYAEVLSLQPYLQLKIRENTATIKQRIAGILKRASSARSEVLSIRPLLSDIVNHLLKDIRLVRKMPFDIKGTAQIESILVDAQASVPALHQMLNEEHESVTESIIDNVYCISDKITSYFARKPESGAEQIVARIKTNIEELLVYRSVYTALMQQGNMGYRSFLTVDGSELVSSEIYYLEKEDIVSGYFFLHSGTAASIMWAVKRHEKQGCLKRIRSGAPEWLLNQAVDLFSDIAGQSDISVIDKTNMNDAENGGLKEKVLVPEAINLRQRKSLTYVA